MAKQQDILYYFEYKKISPSALVQDNLIYFNYHSPNGVHDKTPLVYVLEKRLDRIYGLNVHYDAGELFEIINSTETKINKVLENEFFKKYPEQRKELQKKRIKFHRDLLQEDDKKEFAKRISKRDMEQFLLRGKNDETLRTYLFKRMNSVSKLVWRI